MDLTRPDGTRLYWTAAGHGPAVIMSHGLLASHRSFDALADALLAQGRHVIRWDARGHGRSTWSVGPFSFGDLVEDLLAVIDASEAFRPTLIGHDLGGVVSLAAALEQPDRIGALSLWSVDAGPNPVAQRVQAAMVVASSQVSIRPVTMLLEPLWTRRRPGYDVGATALQRRIASSASPAAIASVAATYGAHPDLRPRVRDLPMPVQVLWGARDLLVRTGAPRELLAAIPHAEGGAVDECAHNLHHDRPEIVAQQVLAFLDRVR